RNGTLYVGMTNNLERRITEHKEQINKSFSSKYNISRLVWYEEFDTAISAIEKEKQIKKWKREWKINLIEKDNPNWKNLYYLF
ncbi:MAG: excinuclease ABC subunit C, partial [Candidatus Peregrinibacteria bacterium GW2011_GWF2_33_10]